LGSYLKEIKRKIKNSMFTVWDEQYPNTPSAIPGEERINLGGRGGKGWLRVK